MVALLSFPPKRVYRLREEHKACRLGLGTPTRHSFSQGQGEIVLQKVKATVVRRKKMKPLL